MIGESGNREIGWSRLKPRLAQRLKPGTAYALDGTTEVAALTLFRTRYRLRDAGCKTYAREGSSGLPQVPPLPPFLCVEGLPGIYTRLREVPAATKSKTLNTEERRKRRIGERDKRNAVGDAERKRKTQPRGNVRGHGETAENRRRKQQFRSW